MIDFVKANGEHSNETTTTPRVRRLMADCGLLGVLRALRPGAPLLLGIIAIVASPMAPATAGDVQGQTLDDQFAAVATQVPEFGGMFFGADEQTLQIYLTDTNADKAAAVQAAIVAVFGATVIPQGGVQALQGQYGFLQLREWYTLIVGPILSTPGVTYTDINEAVNRLRIGLETPDVEMAVLEEITQLGVSPEAIAIEVTGPIEPLSHTLNDAFSPRQGGYEITRLLCNDNVGCGIGTATLGFNAIRAGVAGFVTNSHNTLAFWLLDTLANPCPNDGCVCPPGPCSSCDFYQAPGFFPAEFVGTEAVDPQGFTGFDPQHSITCPSGFTCRYSDSAFVNYDAGVQWDPGIIARTTGLTIWNGSAPCPSSGACILTVDELVNFRITAPPSQPYLHGLKLNKVGRSTGWTSGSIEGTCADYTDSNNRVRLCQYTVGNQLDTDPTNDSWRIATFGDSGSPAFRIVEFNCVELYGIVWGGQDFGSTLGARKFVFSPIGGVPSQMTGIQSSSDLGPFNYLNPSACACVPPPSGMVAWWPLDELAGATEVDDIAPPPSSTVNNQGTPQPGGFVGGGGPSAVAGQVSGASQFDINYVEVLDDGELDFGTGPFTIDAWVKPTHEQQIQPIVAKLDVNANAGYFLFIQQNSLALEIGTGSSIGFLTGPPIIPGQWNFVAAVVSPPNVKLYVGLQTASFGPIAVSTTNTLPLSIGRSPYNPHSYGISIDELELFNVALSPAHIQTIYDAGSDGKCNAQAIPCEAAPHPTCDGLCPQGLTCKPDLSGCACAPVVPTAGRAALIGLALALLAALTLMFFLPRFSRV